MLVAAVILRAACERNLHVLGNSVERGRLEGNLAEGLVALPARCGSFVRVVHNHERITEVLVGVNVRVVDGGVFALERCRVARGEYDRGDGLCRGVDDGACGDGLALFAAFGRLHGVNRVVAVHGEVQVLCGTLVDGDDGDGIAVGATEGDCIDVATVGGAAHDAPARAHEFRVVAHGVVFGVDVELCLGAAAPAFARANADELAVLFTPEEFPGDVGVQLAARKADLHNMGEAEHVLLAHGVFHSAEFRHDDGLVIAAIVLADSGHRLAEVLRVQVVGSGVVVAVTRMVQVVGVTVEVLVVERLRVLFEVAVADAERFGADNLRRVRKRADGIAYGLECLLVTGYFAFGGVEQSFLVFGFHVGFILQADVVRSDARGGVCLQALFPPAGEFAVDELAVRVAARSLERLVCLGMSVASVHAAARFEVARSGPAGHLDLEAVAEALLAGLHDGGIVCNALGVFLLPVADAEQREVESVKCRVVEVLLHRRTHGGNPALVVGGASAKSDNLLCRAGGIYRDICGCRKRCRSKGDRGRRQGFLKHTHILFL